MNYRVKAVKAGSISYHSAAGNDADEVKAKFASHGYQVVEMTEIGETDKSARYTKGADTRTIGEFYEGESK